MKEEEQDTIEKQLINVDWDSLTDADKSEFVIKQAVYFELSKRVSHYSAICAADMRNLMTSMLVVIVMSFLGAETKNIILTLLGLQIVFLILSKISHFFMRSQLELIKSSYMEFLKKKQ